MYFIGYFDPEKVILVGENKYFWGDLTDIPSIKEPLLNNCVVHVPSSPISTP